MILIFLFLSYCVIFGLSIFLVTDAQLLLCMLNFVCVEVQGYLCRGVCVQRSDYSSWELVLSVTLWGLGSKLRTSGLYISASIFKATLHVREEGWVWLTNLLSDYTGCKGGAGIGQAESLNRNHMLLPPPCPCPAWFECGGQNPRPPACWGGTVAGTPRSFTLFAFPKKTQATLLITFLTGE